MITAPTNKRNGKEGSHPADGYLNSGQHSCNACDGDCEGSKRKEVNQSAKLKAPPNVVRLFAALTYNMTKGEVREHDSNFLPFISVRGKFQALWIGHNIYIYIYIGGHFWPDQSGWR